MDYIKQTIYNNINYIFIINLPHHRQKLNKTLNNFPKEFDINKIIIIPGVYYKFEEYNNLLENIEKEMVYLNYNDFMYKTDGAKGCFLAYYRLFKNIIKYNFKRCLIFEDDALFHPNFFQKLFNICLQLNDDMGVIQLTDPIIENWDLQDLINNSNYNNDIIKFTGNESTCNVGYIYLKEELIKIIKFIENIDIKKNILKYNLPIDRLYTCYYNYWSRNYTKTYRNFYKLNNPIVYDSGIFLKNSDTIGLNYNDLIDLKFDINKIIENINIYENNKNNDILNNIIKSKNKLKNYFSHNKNNSVLKIKFISWYEKRKNNIHNLCDYFFEKFLIRHINKNLEIIYDKDNYNPDILFISCFDERNNVLEEIKKYKKSIKIFFTGENLEYRYKEYNDHLLDYVDISLGFQNIINEKYIRFPLWLMLKFNDFTFDDLLANPNLDLNFYFKINNHNLIRNRFCSIVNSWSGITISKRNEIYEIINEYKNVDCLGSFKNNSNFLIDECNNNLIKCLSNYKFNICSENSENQYYVTEKIFNSLFAGTIPIYWNNNDNLKIEENILNQDKFINYSDKNKLLDEIKYLDNNSFEHWSNLNIFNKDANIHIMKYYKDLEDKINKCLNLL